MKDKHQSKRIYFMRPLLLIKTPNFLAPTIKIKIIFDIKRMENKIFKEKHCDLCAFWFCDIPYLEVFWFGILITTNKMQVESSFTKYAGRVPPLDLSNVNSCRNENDLHLWNKTTPGGNSVNGKKHPSYPSHHQHHHHISRQEVQFGTDGLPIDPRDWSRADVWKWLINMAVSEGLEVTPELAQKFPMNGKALCLMSLDMYLSRVPVGGKMLYRDFRVRLARAMAVLS